MQFIDCQVDAPSRRLSMTSVDIAKRKYNMEKLKRSISQFLENGPTKTNSTSGVSLWRTISESSLNNRIDSLKAKDDKRNICKSTTNTIRRSVTVERLPNVTRKEREPLRPAIKKHTRPSRSTAAPRNENESLELESKRRVTFSTYTLLLEAASENSVTELRNLLEKHPAYVNKPSSSGATALHKAAAQGNTECVRLLLDCGADPNLTDRQGRTPMFLAWNCQHTASFRLMLETAE